MDVSPGNTAGSAYAAPVARLFELGMIPVEDRREWRDYVGDFGLGSDHVADLIRVARDESLDEAEDDKLLWAPVHAWRAIGQLGAKEAVAPLLDHLRSPAAYDDMVSEDFPTVFGMIGPEAIAALDAFFVEDDVEEIALTMLTSAYVEIGKRHPESRAACVDALQRFLARDDDVNPQVNGFLVSALLDLDAREALDAMRAAFERDVVDHTIAGDMEDVEIAFGLRETRSKPRRKNSILERLARLSDRAGIGRDSAFATPRSTESRDSGPLKRVKIGRNERCPCGSGKKYKKCCMA